MPTQEQQLTLARHVESSPASVDRCAALWLDLLSGEQAILRAFAREKQSVLILQTRVEPAAPLVRRAQEILKRTLLGDRRKVIAQETNVSPSTVAFVLKDSLACLGLHCRPSRVPSALVALAHAACGVSRPVGLFIGGCRQEGRRITVVTHVFDYSALRGLPPSERAVVGLLASGQSCVDIAARRNRSSRTVINQVAAAYRRLGVSSRLELLHRFATLHVGTVETIEF